MLINKDEHTHVILKYGDIKMPDKVDERLKAIYLQDRGNGMWVRRQDIVLFLF